MADVIKRLGHAQAPSSAGSIYTVPAQKAAVVRVVKVVNVAGAARQITLYESGTTTADIWEGVHTLQPGESIEFPTFMTLEAGRFVGAVSDAANAVNVFVYGLESDV